MGSFGGRGDFGFGFDPDPDPDFDFDFDPDPDFGFRGLGVIRKLAKCRVPLNIDGSARLGRPGRKPGACPADKKS